MRGIQLLDSSLINKIAAGEVVERPASVVKELVENALDAGASSVTVEIRDGGLAYIRVADDGAGIPKEQVKTAFLRHATSKIQNLEDLEGVLSLGFRGEALASVAAVAHVEMTTKTEEEDTGSLIEINGGSVEREAETGVARGTTVIVRNIFYNTPARRKFMKKPSAEAGAVSELVQKLAIGRPDVAFTCINNGVETLRTKGGGDLRTTLLNVYGTDTVKNLVALSGGRDGPSGLRLEGFAGKPNIGRGNRGHEHFFLNGRCVRSALVSSAAENAYQTLLMHGKFPFYVIKMEMNPEMVDVNVHPAKLEVRFARENDVYEAVRGAVAEALGSASLIPETPLPKPNINASAASQPRAAPLQQAMKLLYGGQSGGTSMREKGPEQSDTYDNAPSYMPWSKPGAAAPPVKMAGDKKADDTPPLRTEPLAGEQRADEANRRAPLSYRVVGQAFGTYWFVEREGALLVVDQHAAHERVLYDEVIQKAKAGGASAQMLLQPVVLRLTEREVDVFNENKALFESFGFDVEPFGGEAYALRAVPSIVKGSPDANFFIEILDKLSDLTTAVSSLHETKLDAIATIACKAAVKANDYLGYAEARALIERLLALEQPYTCPHGRPTMVELTKYELEKMFKRV